MNFKEDFNADCLQDELHGKTQTIGRRIIFLQETNSTNDFADKLAESGAEEGTVVIADSQTAGVGRHGRNWFSPPDKNLYLSVILKHPISVPDAGLITLMAAVAACSALNKSAPIKTLIKWPNDIICNERKLGGILTGLKSSGGRVRHAVLGIGLNINICPGGLPEEIREIATSVNIETGTRLSRKELAAKLLTNIDRWYLKLISGGGRDIIAAWTELSLTIGKRVSAKTAEGIYTGTATGVEGSGMLLIRLDDNSLKKISSGEIIHLR
ncbi:MAG: biotin--[acetyl-CoA-carboxylase] ligase [Nitrospirae bacterium]|nr:MAG: biotin--[acetyl-CoA-carboxylase] ligase [Nitrospirota bacterium]